MNIRWKIKAKIFSIIVKYKAYNLLYFFQKIITKRSTKINPDDNRNAEIHYKIINKKGLKKILEFGAGKSLHQNLYLNYLNKDLNQTLIDKFNMLDIELVNKRIVYLNRKFSKNFKQVKSSIDLKDFNIKYISPISIKNLRVQEKFDICINSNTLEHLTINNLKIYLQQLRKKIKKNGYISSVIDYSDHYSHTDKSISELNFLKFNNRDWRKYNFNCHYQNRLRHHNYIKIFKQNGYKILESKILKRIKNKDDPFYNYKFNELCGYILVIKK